MPTRRGFVVASSASLALVALRARRAFPDPLGIPIGLQLYTVYSELKTDFEGTLRQIAAIGTREVELLDFPERKPREMRRALADAGLHAVSIHLDGDNIYKDPQRYIDLAGELGVAYLTCPRPLTSPAARLRPEFAEAQKSPASFPKLIATMTLDDWRWNAEALNQLGENASKASLQLGYHNHSPEFRHFGDEVPYDELIKLTDPRWVTFEMDCGWVESSHASARQYLEKYPGRFRLLHIKDIKRRANPGVEFQIASTEVGRGIIEWKPIFAAARKAGVQAYFIEQEPPFDRSALDAVRLSYDWLHALD